MKAHKHLTFVFFHDEVISLKHQHGSKVVSFRLSLRITEMYDEFRFEMLWKAALKHRMREGLKNCPGLELLIVSSVLAKSAGCDSRPLSVTR